MTTFFLVFFQALALRCMVTLGSQWTSRQTLELYAGPLPAVRGNGCVWHTAITTGGLHPQLDKYHVVDCKLQTSIRMINIVTAQLNLKVFTWSTHPPTNISALYTVKLWHFSSVSPILYIVIILWPALPRWTPIATQQKNHAWPGHACAQTQRFYNIPENHSGYFLQNKYKYKFDMMNKDLLSIFGIILSDKTKYK